MSLSHSQRRQANLKRYLLATILPIIFLSLSLSLQIYDQIKMYSFTKTEIKGIEVLEVLYNSLIDLQKIRGYSQISFWGGHDKVDRNIRDLQQQFLERLNKSEWQLKVEEFQFKSEVEQIKKKAAELFQIKTGEVQEKTLFDKYTRLITDILQLLQLTAAHSYLILDPDLDTYYLIDVLDTQIPYLVEAIGRVRGLESGFLAKRTISPEEKERLNIFRAAILARIESIKNAQDTINKASSGLNNSLQLLPENFDATMAPLFLKQETADPADTGIHRTPEDFFTLATRCIDTLSTPYQTGIALLTSRLKTRLQKHLLQGACIFLGTGIAIILLLYFNRAFFLYDQKLHEEMAHLSITDQLTGLYNRRHFYETFPRELRKTFRNGERLYIALLDVDNFKLYNDNYGHPAGDHALKCIARAMTDVLKRAGDYCFRIGGEEFCCLFSESDMEKATQFANRIRLNIQELNLEHKANIPHGMVTVSLGLVMVPADPDAILEQVMTQADKALYRAKESGRNRCEIFS